MVLAQYYNFVRFGREGYAYIMDAMQKNAWCPRRPLKASGNFELIGADEEQLPLVAFKLVEREGLRRVRRLLAALRRARLDAPAYTMPPNAEEVKVMRALVKQTLSRQQVDRLADDIATAC